VFISFILQFLRNGGPLLPIQPYKLYQREVLLLQPVLLQLGRIEVVEPPLPTLLGRPEETAIGLNKQGLAQVTPLQPVVVPLDQLLEKLVLLMDPFLILVVLLQEVLPLVYEQLPRLAREDLGEEPPVVGRSLFGLN
jgi:hypothetical protein